MINNPLLEAVDASFQQEVRSFLAHELAPRAAAIEDQQDWHAVKAAVQGVGAAGYLRLMFPELYRGALGKPGLTHATLLSEEAAYVNYAFETTIATALSCAYALHRNANPALRDRFLTPIVDGRAIGAQDRPHSAETVNVESPRSGEKTAHRSDALFVQGNRGWRSWSRWNGLPSG